MDNTNSNINLASEMEPITDCAEPMPKTKYEVAIAGMTPEILASLGVRLISVNNSDLYWVTSTGQLYAFNAQKQAIEAEYAWLMSTPE